MARQMPRLLPGRWTIKSVNVKVRDGPERVRQVYRLLLTAPARKGNGISPKGREKHNM
jgi:hypothetical protein